MKSQWMGGYMDLFELLCGRFWPSLKPPRGKDLVSLPSVVVGNQVLYHHPQCFTILGGKVVFTRISMFLSIHLMVCSWQRLPG